MQPIAKTWLAAWISPEESHTVFWHATFIDFVDDAWLDHMRKGPPSTWPPEAVALKPGTWSAQSRTACNGGASDVVVSDVVAFYRRPPSDARVCLHCNAAVAKAHREHGSAPLQATRAAFYCTTSCRQDTVHLEGRDVPEKKPDCPKCGGPTSFNGWTTPPPPKLLDPPSTASKKPARPLFVPLDFECDTCGARPHNGCVNPDVNDKIVHRASPHALRRRRAKQRNLAFAGGNPEESAGRKASETRSQGEAEAAPGPAHVDAIAENVDGEDVEADEDLVARAERRKRIKAKGLQYILAKPDQVTLALERPPRPRGQRVPGNAIDREPREGDYVVIVEAGREVVARGTHQRTYADRVRGRDGVEILTDAGLLHCHMRADTWVLAPLKRERARGVPKTALDRPAIGGDDVAIVYMGKELGRGRVLDVHPTTYGPDQFGVTVRLDSGGEGGYMLENAWVLPPLGARRDPPGAASSRARAQPAKRPTTAASARSDATSPTVALRRGARRTCGSAPRTNALRKKRKPEDARAARGSATCPDCGAKVATTKNGDLYRHKRGGGGTVSIKASEVCTGSNISATWLAFSASLRLYRTRVTSSLKVHATRDDKATLCGERIRSSWTVISTKEASGERDACTKCAQRLVSELLAATPGAPEKQIVAAARNAGYFPTAAAIAYGVVLAKMHLPPGDPVWTSSKLPQRAVENAASKARVLLGALHYSPTTTKNLKDRKAICGFRAAGARLRFTATPDNADCEMCLLECCVRRLLRTSQPRPRSRKVAKRRARAVASSKRGRIAIGDRDGETCGERHPTLEGVTCTRRAGHSKRHSRRAGAGGQKGIWWTSRDTRTRRSSTEILTAIGLKPESSSARGRGEARRKGTKERGRGTDQFAHGGFRLWVRTVALKGGKNHDVYFFATRRPKIGKPSPLPQNYEVETLSRTGLPILRRKGRAKWHQRVQEARKRAAARTRKQPSNRANASGPRASSPAPKAAPDATAPEIKSVKA